MRFSRQIELVCLVSLMCGFTASASAQSVMNCQRWAGGNVTCNVSAPPAPAQPWVNPLIAIREREAAEKKDKEERAAEAAFRESQLAQQQELIRLQTEAADAERASMAALGQQQANAQQEREAARQAEQELRTKVSTAVLEGRCEDAKTIALLASRIDMAEQAMRLCKPKVPAKKSKSSKARADSGPITKPSLAQFGSVSAPQASTAPSKSSARDSVVAAVPTIIAARQSPGLDTGISLGGGENVPPSSNADHQYSQGLSYYRGEGVEQDYPTALVWYRKAAEQGHAAAQQSIGDMYYRGKGVARDYSNALVWHLKAAEQGYAPAQQSIGDMYYRGEGVERDYATALVWYRKAAEQGQLEALNSIGYMYYYGVGVTQDHQIAVSWYNKGVALGGKLPRELWFKPTIK